MGFIELNNVLYTLKNKKQLFNYLNLVLEQDEIVSLVGDNGCGKTTLSKLMIGSIRADLGSVCLDNKDIEDYKLFEIGRQIGYLFQNPDLQLFNPTIEDELMFSSQYVKELESGAKERFKRIVKDLSLSECLNTNTQNLSQGEKQRVALGTILMNKPKYLILDEPTTGLDYQRKAELLEILINIHSQGIGMLIISHDMSFINKLPGKVLKLENGRIDYV